MKAANAFFLAGVVALGFLVGHLVRTLNFPPLHSAPRDILRHAQGAAAAALAGSLPEVPRRLAAPAPQPPAAAPAPSSPSPAALMDASTPWPPAFLPLPPLPRAYDLRNCECAVGSARYAGRFEGPLELGLVEEGAAACACTPPGGRDPVPCPASVGLDYLTEAHGQDFCTLRRYTGYASCTVDCSDGRVAWALGQRCQEPSSDGGSGAPGLPPCPLPLAPVTNWRAKSPDSKLFNVNNAPPPPVTWDPAAVVDLRGLKCEIAPPPPGSAPGAQGTEVCFMDDRAQGRTLCPAYVTSAYLRAPPTEGAHAITPHMADRCSPLHGAHSYCTVACQPGNDAVVWSEHDIAWCYSRENGWACPSMRPEALVPMASFTVPPWSAPSPSPAPCHAAHAAGVRLGKVEGVTMAILAHEPLAFERSMATYEELGLFDVAVEILVYLNLRSPELEAIVDQHAAARPGLIRVLGTPANIGIAAAFNELNRAASHPFVLFLERDFWLVEPGACIVQQLEAGKALLDTGKVHVVRYRHKVMAGRPNWAESFYRGHEDDVFSSRQPNLACNHFYWVDEPHRRWPDKFFLCGTDPEFLCSDSYDCNWTNNPQLYRVDWWRAEYEEYLPTNPKDDIGACPFAFCAHHALPRPSHTPGAPPTPPPPRAEYYMNYGAGKNGISAWNERKWTVAQGDGLFMHVVRRGGGAVEPPRILRPCASSHLLITFLTPALFSCLRTHQSGRLKR